jgi:hypothetical protein
MALDTYDLKILGQLAFCRDKHDKSNQQCGCNDRGLLQVTLPIWISMIGLRLETKFPTHNQSVQPQLRQCATISYANLSSVPMVVIRLLKRNTANLSLCLS